MSHSVVHRLSLHLGFPEGVRPGAGKTAGNQLVLARDGAGRAVLRGSALAGALRHGLARRRGVSSTSDDVNDLFGLPCDRKQNLEAGKPSRMRVSDVVLAGPEATTTLRHHNSIDRHFGSVRDGGLFSMEALPPGTSGHAVLELHADEDVTGKALASLRDLAAVLDAGLVLGGSSARGIGRVALVQRPLYRRFDLRDVEEHAVFLDERLETRRGRFPVSGEPLAEAESSSGSLRVELLLGIPRGQDFLIGGGDVLDFEMEPQRSVDASGKEHWRLPGSSLRGVFRAWMTRLAARERWPVGDQAQPAGERKSATGAEVMWCFKDKKQREEIQDRLATRPNVATLRTLVECPIAQLFGSGFARGRIHFSDALALAEDGHVARRKHVAIDRITGGANDGFLFENKVLVHSRLSFAVVIHVHDPTESEAKWLAATIRALDRGLVRVGSSKAGGRLALLERPRAMGPCHEHFETIQPSEVIHA